MAHSIDLATHQLLGLGRGTLATLRAALLRDAGPAAAAYLQEAGYAGGEQLYAAFRAWLGAEGAGEPEDLPVQEFEQRATEFLRVLGWGSLTIGTLSDAVATLDSSDWGEADPASGLDHTGCYVSTGLLADFFGRVADFPLAVLEVECRSMGHDRCRFLLGNAEVMEFLFEQMGQGVAYEAAAAEVE